MKNPFYNISYFFREARIMLRLNLLSNIMTILSTGLIFFILAMVISGWSVSSKVVEVIQGEAEVNVYLNENIDYTGTMRVLERIKAVEGVREARVVGEGEAYSRMVDILGKEARVLEFFDENPFSSFIEVKINLEEMDSVLGKLDHMTEIEHIRDNRDVLERLRSIADMIKLLGYLVASAVGISTLVIISHIIRLGINNSRDQINTLRLLGAPEAFIAFPFLLEGLLLTLGGGVLAASIAALTLNYLYYQLSGPLPFIPLPPAEALISGMATVILSLSAVLGIVGSLFGLLSAKSK